MVRILAVTLAWMATACMAQSPTVLRATTDDGKRVVLRSDGTWEFVKTESSAPVGEPNRYVKPAKATKEIKASFGKFALWIDPNRWTEASSAPGRIMLQHVNGQAYAMFISEGIGIPNGALKEVALLNARKADPNVQLVSEEMRVVNDREVLCLMMNGLVKSIPFRYYGYYYGGTSGTVQLVAYTVPRAFEANRADFTDLLNGLEIADQPLPAAESASSAAPVSQIPLNGGKVVVSFDPRKWSAPRTDADEKITLSHANGAGFALIVSEGLEIPFDSVPEFALENLKKVDPNANVVFREKRKVNGEDVWCMKTEMMLIKGVPVIWYGYYYGGHAGTVQVVTYTSRNQFRDYEHDFTEFLNGLKVTAARP